MMERLKHSQMQTYGFKMLSRIGGLCRNVTQEIYHEQHIKFERASDDPLIVFPQSRVQSTSQMDGK